MKHAIEANPNLTDQQKQDLLKPLNDAQAQLRQPNLSQEQAVQILTQTQQQLKQLTDPNAQAQALANAAQTLGQNAQTQAPARCWPLAMCQAPRMTWQRSMPPL